MTRISILSRKNGYVACTVLRTREIHSRGKKATLACVGNSLPSSESPGSSSIRTQARTVKCCAGLAAAVEEVRRR